MKKHIVYAMMLFGLFACSEDEIKSYQGEQYIYFSHLMDGEEGNISVSFNNYPISEEITVKIGLGLIGDPMNMDRPYKVTVVQVEEPEEGGNEEEKYIPNADSKNYRLPENPAFKANEVTDSLEVTLVKTDDLKENVRLRLKLEPNEYFQGVMRQYEQIDVVFNNIVSKPLWWTKDVEKLYLGAYSRTKYEALLKYTSYTGEPDFGALDTATKRAMALELKEAIAEHNLMDKNDETGEEFPMEVPIN